LWDHDLNAYLLPELLADIGQGHNVVSTVFVECGSMYNASVDKAMAPVGETEFVNGIAAMSASGQYGPAKLCAGIVSYADLTLGDDVGPVLDAHIVASPRFRGIRHAAGWDASEAIRNSHTKPTENLFLEEKFQRGFAQLEKRGLSFDAWLYHPQITDLTVLAKAFPKVTIVFDHFGGPLGIGPYSGKGEEIFNQWQKDVAQLATFLMWLPN
jgi:predicted TIM-barrel fold metal-dependent hydrolase